MFGHEWVKDIDPEAAPACYVKLMVVNKVFDAPHPAELQLVCGHEQVVKRDPVISQPLPRDAIGAPQIPVSADNDPPLIPPEPLHELDAVSSRRGEAVAKMVDFIRKEAVFGAEELARVSGISAQSLDVFMEGSRRDGVGFVVGKVSLPQRLGEIIESVIQIYGYGLHL